MSEPYIYAIISVVVVSLVSFAGAFVLLVKEHNLKKYLFIFISLAVGALLGDAFIHLIPETVRETGNILFVLILVASGILIFFLLEKVLHWHHHGEDVKDKHIHPVGEMVLVSDGLHNFIDGLIIGVSYFISIPVGIATTVAVILHEIPQEIGDLGVLIYSGFTKRRALWLNFLSALVSIFGVVIVFMFRNSVGELSVWVTPFAAGGFIYIAVIDLIPELRKSQGKYHSIVQVATVLFGIFVMATLSYF